METKNKKLKNIIRIILIIAVVAMVIVYFAVPAVKNWFDGILKLFASMDTTVIAEYIRSFGIYAVIVSFLLMVFQSVAAPLPAFLITFANAAVFGWWQGAILSWTSSMVGAYLCFMIARLAGRDVVEKLTSKFAMESVDGYFEKYGNYTILICRLLPFVSFDFISYAAGLTAMGAVPFLVATGLGQLPATIVYSYVGGMLKGSAKTVVTALLIIFALFAFVFLFKKMYNSRNEKKTAKDEENVK